MRSTTCSRRARCWPLSCGGSEGGSTASASSRCSKGTLGARSERRPATRSLLLAALPLHVLDEGQEARVRAELLEPGVARQVAGVAIAELDVALERRERLLGSSHERVETSEV